MMFGIRCKFALLRNYWWIMALLIMGTLVFLLITAQPLSIVIPTVGSLLSVVYFVQRQKLEELQLFRELFKDFNCRYDAMNEALALINESQLPHLTAEEKLLLVDYFNLCGEEYFYFSRGYLDPVVWRAWENGMKAIVKNPKIRSFWDDERGTGSYYGLQI